MKIASVTGSVIMGLCIGFLIAAYAGVGAQSLISPNGQPPGPPDRPERGILYLANHHSEIAFDMGEGGQKSMRMPKSDLPVSLNIAILAMDNEGTPQRHLAVVTAYHDTATDFVFISNGRLPDFGDSSVEGGPGDTIIFKQDPHSGYTTKHYAVSMWY